MQLGRHDSGRRLDAMTELLGDPRVMTYYPRPKTRDETQRWIEWNKTNYREHGFGLWILETNDGQFIGDCGLTMRCRKDRTACRGLRR